MAESPQFSPDAAGFLRRIAVYCVALAAVMSALLAGPAWVNLLTASLAIMALPLAGAYLLLRRLRPLHFDDAAARVVPCWGTPIPYVQIRTWSCREEGAHFSLEARLASQKTRRLALALPETQREALEQAIEQRQPEAVVAQRQFPTQALIIGLLAPILLLYAPFVWYLHQKYPALPAELRQADWLTPAGATAPGPRVEVGGWEARLPPGYDPDPAASDEQAFLDPSGRTRIVLQAEPRQASDASPLTRLMLRAFGAADSFDLFALAYQARNGIVPLALKAVILGDAPGGSVELWGLESATLEGLLEITVQDDSARVNLLLRHQPAPTTLLIAIRAPEKPSRSLIAQLVAGVQPPR